MLLFLVSQLSLVFLSLASKVVCKQSPRPVGFQCNESFSQRTQKITNKGNSTFFNRVKNNLTERFLQLSFLTLFQVFAAARDRFVLLHHFSLQCFFARETNTDFSWGQSYKIRYVFKKTNSVLNFFFPHFFILGSSTLPLYSKLKYYQ
jgi:hypothetical protein